MARGASRGEGPIAVLTGDLMRSTALSHEDLLVVREALAAAAAEIARWNRGQVHGPDFFRGDSWQLVLMDGSLFLRAAVFLRATLRALEQGADTRIAIGVGGFDVLDERYVSRSVGEAFTLSGRSLDGMSRLDGLSLDLSHWSTQYQLLPAILAFCSHVVDTWSPSQARVALKALLPGDRTQGDVGEALGVTRQAVNKVYRQSGLPAVLTAIEAFEALALGERSDDRL